MLEDDRVIVFDLDDTLYLERDFVRSGFKAADDWLTEKTGIAGLAGRCNALFDAGQRTKIFDEAITSLEIPDKSATIPALVKVYRGHVPTIALAADAKDFLNSASRIRRRAIITDGPAATQMAKVQALGLDRMIDLIIYTDQWGREYWKPHARAFEAVQAWANLGPSKMVYVADNPLKDFVTPRRLGWSTIRVHRNDRVHRLDPPTPSHDAQAHIIDLGELADCLAGLNAATGNAREQPAWQVKR